MLRSFAEEQGEEATRLIDFPGQETPSIICKWIFTKCDSMHKSSEKAPFTFSHASKMRAAATWWYRYERQMGLDRFQRGSDGKWSGNPTKSYQMTAYMKSLERRKVRRYP